jgi:hypothetical protein
MSGAIFKQNHFALLDGGDGTSKPLGHVSRLIIGRPLVPEWLVRKEGPVCPLRAAGDLHCQSRRISFKHGICQIGVMPG